ncbi:hypothetical protein MKW94_014374 [Papaver nudicaule]|uniref:Uncharacterized protein n=1 Tax=Papaver nudicaule TaxID=74823 RepID=A0AA41VYT4_PAPNU|nr:hypothetical protein [Papaver nudicaule]
MESGDDWFALDKLYHVLFCFFISIFVSTTLAITRYPPFLRRWSIWIGSLVSMSAGAAKEAGDEIGLWKSAGASTKDAIADLFGILLAYLSMKMYFYHSLFTSSSINNKPDEEEMAVIRRDHSISLKINTRDMDGGKELNAKSFLYSHNKSMSLLVYILCIWCCLKDVHCIRLMRSLRHKRF